ncbi:MAG: hypothetical protein B7Z08_00865 [Sphingomonadales bacterium 32-68-7]|nr:MAG: hypothetical protein B7Z08_00865 [Sphingomonadales bacterium 32-68-7]
MHLLLQLLGKLPTRLHPWINHGWHVALRMTPRGPMTRDLPAGERHFTAALDMLDGTIRVVCDTGAESVVPAARRTLAQVHADLSALLRSLGLPAPLHGKPNELPDPVAFADDRRPRAWDPDAAQRLLGAFLCADRQFNVFRSLYRGKSSPSHLFWGSLDLAVTRFSGRTAPEHPGGVPHLPDAVTREAYSHEVISAGFWPGNDAYPHAAFYAYAYPVPPGLAEASVLPAGAFWQADMGEFLLPYQAVRAAPDPGAALQAFLQSTYQAAAERLHWPRGLTLAAASIGRPPA